MAIPHEISLTEERARSLPATGHAGDPRTPHLLDRNAMHGMVPHGMAALFRLEVDALLTTTAGRHRGAGRIVCRVNRTQPEFRRVVELLVESSGRFYLDGRPVPAMSASLRSEGDFQLPVHFDVAGGFTISLGLAGSEACHIPGSPFAVEELATRIPCPGGGPYLLIVVPCGQVVRWCCTT